MITETLEDNTQERKRRNDTEEKERRNVRESLFVKDNRVCLRRLPGPPLTLPGNYGDGRWARIKWTLINQAGALLRANREATFLITALQLT